jgi:DNA sulfur modification protein DndD
LSSGLPTSFSWQLSDTHHGQPGLETDSFMSSLRFERVSLNNWGPFYKSHSLDFSSKAGKSLVLIFGNIGQGKTSLANAIRWCLYANQSWLDVDPLLYANWRSRDTKEEFDVSVQLTFRNIFESAESHDSTTQGISPVSDEWTLTRSQTVVFDGRRRHSNLIKPVSGIKSSLLKNGQPEVDELVDRIVLTLFPKTMNEFLLFDGERLRRTLQNLGGSERVSVRGYVEAVLGVEVIKNQADLVDADLNTVDKSLRAKQKNQALQDEADRLAAEINSHKADLADAERQRSQYEELVEEALSKLENYESFEEQIARLKVLETSLKDLTPRLSTSQHNLRKQLEQLWWIPLIDRVSKRQDRERARKTSDQRASEIQVLTDLVNRGACPTCGHEHHDTNVFRERLESLRRSPEVQDDDEISFPFLNGFGDPGRAHESLLGLFREERDLLQQRNSLRQEINQLNSDLIGVDREEFQTLVSNYRINYDALHKLNHRIQKLSEVISELTAKHIAKRKTLAGGAEIPRDLEARQSALLQIGEILRNCAANLTDGVRVEVAKRASEHYSTMMQNPDLLGLLINEEFAIRAIHRVYGEKSLSSFGQSLIYVYAFIGALIDVSDLPNPWLIDMVASQLDLKHMKSMWQWLATQNRQVITMPHDRELTPDLAREWVIDDVARMWQIVPNELSDADSRFEEVSL